MQEWSIYHGNMHARTVEKYVIHIYTPRHTYVPSFMEIVQNKIFHDFGSYVNRCHGNTLFVTVEKCVMLTYILRQTFIMSSMSIGRILRKQFAMNHFALVFVHNMLLPWQHTFCHNRIMYFAQ